MTKIKRFLLLLFIILAFCFLWMTLEVIFYGQVQNRMVDNIIMMLFLPFIWVTTGKIIK